MNNVLTTEKEIEQDIRENHLHIVDDWSSEELERIFNLDDDGVAIGHAMLEKELKEGPNYFLIGGPYPNYNKAK